jgi:tetratricopeptide (TPR) repeat protein
MITPRLLIAVLVFWVAVGASAIQAQGQTAEKKIADALKLMEDESQREQGRKLLREARGELETAAAANPRDAAILLNLASARFYMNEDDKALEAIDRAIALEPKTASLASRKADMLMQMNRYAEAKKAYMQAAALDPADATAVLMAGVALTSMGKDVEALELFRKAAQIKPDYVMAWANIGQICQNQEKPAEALQAFRTGWKLQKDDFKLLSKIIQCEQALGQIKERDSDRAQLFKMHKEGKIIAQEYCREQFKVNQTKVMVLEHFELEGDRAVRYAFHVLDQAGESTRRISLGSYDATTKISRELGEIGKDERMFHLDEYTTGRHATYGMFKKEPTYEETRKMVVKILTDKMKPLSSTEAGEPASKP